jgi:maltose alpha-D-glucosyltransferase / alpha-amylase
LVAEDWYKTAVIYCLAVETFIDGDGDGIGDFEGLVGRLDYLAWLGVDCLWLEPFFTSPWNDHGYDVADHYAVDPRLGTLAQFERLTREAESRGIRVLVDLVFNHTSDEHSWFVSARSDRDSKHRDYYVWTDDPATEPQQPNAFPTRQSSPWAYDEQAAQYYLHRFYAHEPDLNVAHPELAEELKDIADFWLERGIAGFRVDAAHFLVQKLEQSGDPDPHRLLRELHELVTARRPDGVLLAEADVDMGEVPDFFADGQECTLLLNFVLDCNIFLALARQEAEPLRRILRALPEPPEDCQWANFIRNQDELNLARLSDEERDRVFDVFARSPKERAFGRGIRRRVPAMLRGDRRRIELVYSLLFSLPGTPVLGYGDEIGMGDDLDLPERMSVRTPMQWSAEPGGGFSSATEDGLTPYLISTGDFGHERINLEDQRRDPGSLVNWIRATVEARRKLPEIGQGRLVLLKTDNPAVFAHACESRGRGIAAVHNLSPEPCAFGLNGLDRELRDESLPADREYGEFDPARVALGPYGYRWLRFGDS